MSIPRKLGTMVFMGVPVIVGGGIVYALMGGLTPMFIYEGLLAIFALGFLARH